VSADSAAATDGKSAAEPDDSTEPEDSTGAGSPDDSKPDLGEPGAPFSKRSPFIIGFFVPGAPAVIAGGATFLRTMARHALGRDQSLSPSP